MDTSRFSALIRLLVVIAPRSIVQKIVQAIYPRGVSYAKEITRRRTRYVPIVIYMLVEPTLSILQYNVNKSRDKVMIPLFEQQNTLLYDILAIQEPWKIFFKIQKIIAFPSILSLPILITKIHEFAFSLINFWLSHHGPSPIIVTIFQHSAFKSKMTK